MSSHFKKNYIRMSAMNDSEFEQAASIQATANTGKSIGSPSSPSSLSSTSSTTSNHSSSSNQQQALQAAVQALLQQNQHGLLTPEKNTNMQALQQQQMGQLLASIAAAQQQQSAQPPSNNLLNTLMQQHIESNGKKPAKTQKPKLDGGLNINLKTNTKVHRSLKGNSVSPPGTGSSCSDDQEAHSPTDSDQMVKAEPLFSESNADQGTGHFKNRKKSLKSIKSEENDDELDRSTNSSISHDLANQTDHLHESHNNNDDLEDELEDYETSFSRDPKRHRNHSTSSPTRSTSSTPHSRSTSPSTTSYHDSPAAFPILNPLDSATAMLGGLNCTPGGGFSSFLDTSTDSGKKRRSTKGGDSASERNKKIKPVPADKKDDAYWERRRKNNEAAKRSRDLRRQKEDEIAVKATCLEQENLKLKAQVTILKAELSKLHFMLYNR